MHVICFSTCYSCRTPHSSHVFLYLLSVLVQGIESHIVARECCMYYAVPMYKMCTSYGPPGPLVIPLRYAQMYGRLKASKVLVPLVRFALLTEECSFPLMCNNIVNSCNRTECKFALFRNQRCFYYIS